MAIQAFSAQVGALLGISATTLSNIQSDLDTWLNNGYKEIVNILPPYMYDSMAEESNVTDATSLKNLTTTKVLSVMRMSPSGYKTCRPVTSDMRGRIEDEDDLHYATADDPVWFWGSLGNLTVKPNSSDILIRHISYPTGLDASADNAVSSISLTGVAPVTQANPASFTKTAHGLSVGDTVHLSNFTEMTELNGMSTQVATVADANTFTLEGVNSAGFTTAESTGGNVLKKSSFPDEAEPALVLYVAVKAGEYLLANEEDMELLTPIIGNLKDDYMRSVNALNGLTTTQQGARG